MTRRQKLFLALSYKHAEDILEFIYKNEQVSFKEIVERFKLSESSVRKITNALSRVGMIKNVRNKASQDRRARGYIINNLDLLIKIGEL